MAPQDQFEDVRRRVSAKVRGDVSQPEDPLRIPGIVVRRRHGEAAALSIGPSTALGLVSCEIELR